MSTFQEMAASDDPGERQTAIDVTRGRLLHAALIWTACDYDENVDRNEGAYSGVYEDILNEAVLEYASVLNVLQAKSA